MGRKLKKFINFKLDTADKGTYIAHATINMEGKLMINRKQGFTLMEIMVVIIVIAVLASVAGPMIGSITDQGRTSATKSKMSSLKSAMLAYKSDVGRIPFSGLAECVGCAAAYNDAWNNYLADNEANNVLVNEDVGCTTEFCITNYGRKWKGPYMDSSPEDFMMDSWGVKIEYFAHINTKSVYLRSAGPDMAYEATDIDSVVKGNDEGIDDFAQSIIKLRKLN